MTNKFDINDTKLISAFCRHLLVNLITVSFTNTKSDKTVQSTHSKITNLKALVYAQLEEFKGKEEELLMIEGKVIVLFIGDKVKLLNSFPYVGTGLQLMDSLTGKYYRQKRAVE